MKDLWKEVCNCKFYEKLLNCFRDYGNNKIMIYKVFIRKIIEKYGMINVILFKKDIKMYGFEELENL